MFDFFDEGVFIYEQIRNIELYTDQKLKDLQIRCLNIIVRKIETCMVLVIWVKYMSLLQFEEEVMPFTFADVLILRYLVGNADENQTVNDFNMINNSSSLNWSFKSQVSKLL